MQEKIYLIKHLAPWMVDELIAFSNHAQFTIILLRKQKKFYDDDIEHLRSKGIEILVQPMSYSKLLPKLIFLIKFFLTNLTKFRFDYNGVIGLKSMAWFLTMDLTCFSSKSSLHAQFATQPAIIALLIKKFYKNLPEYSFTFHAYDIYFDNRWFNLLTNESKNAFSISRYNINYVENRYEKLNQKKIKLSRLGVLRPDGTIKTRDKKATFTLGLMSWFTEKKGIKYLLEAMTYLCKGNRVKLILAGDGPLKNYILDYINSNSLQNSIEYIGKLKKTQKQDFFAAIDLFVLPAITLSNDQDGIPVVLMEAISYGLPLITTNISGIPEICKDNYNGYLIPQKDSSSIVDSCVDIMTTPDVWHKFSKNALKLSLMYDIDVNSKKKLKYLAWY